MKVIHYLAYAVKYKQNAWILNEMERKQFEKLTDSKYTSLDNINERTFDYITNTKKNEKSPKKKKKFQKHKKNVLTFIVYQK